MTTNAIIETYIDIHVKDEATTVLATMGLTISDAIRLMLIKVADEHKLPFDPFIPNAETVEAMEEARLGGLQSTETVEQFVDAMKSLMRKIEWTTAFKRDFKKIAIFESAFVEALWKLANDEPLPERFCDHPLTENGRTFEIVIFVLI